MQVFHTILAELPELPNCEKLFYIVSLTTVGIPIANGEREP